MIGGLSVRILSTMVLFLEIEINSYFEAVKSGPFNSVLIFTKKTDDVAEAFLCVLI